MDIRITQMFNNICPSDCSASVAEIGRNAGSATWQASLEEADNYQDGINSDQVQAIKDYIESAGFGEDVQSMDKEEVVALFIQFVTGDIRDVMPEFGDSTENFDWEEYEVLANEGQCSSSLYKDENGEIWYYVGV